VGSEQVVHVSDLRHCWTVVVGHDRFSWRYDSSTSSSSSSSASSGCWPAGRASWVSTTAVYTTVGADARNRMLKAALARLRERQGRPLHLGRPRHHRGHRVAPWRAAPHRLAIADVQHPNRPNSGAAGLAAKSAMSSIAASRRRHP